MNFKSLRILGALGLAIPLSALAGQPVDVEIRDRTTGQVLPVYWHDGDRHVAGEPGHEYEIRIRNDGNGRMLAVTSVDGVNVITGRTASPDQSGYVVESHGRVAIDGWRKSMEEVAAFYFTALPDSYAARTGRPDNVGVIGVALFREAPVYVPALERESGYTADAAPPASRKSSGVHEERARNDSRLGTGHGQRLDSGAVYTQFERANSKPDEIIRIYYDSRRNLVARGVIPRPHHRYAQRQPEPFPQAFVPIPKGDAPFILGRGRTPSLLMKGRVPFVASLLPNGTVTFKSDCPLWSDALTELLFRDDAYLKTATARVVGVQNGQVELDRTIFYPLGGGQPGDIGLLVRENGERIAVTDTRKGGVPGSVSHLVAAGGTLPEIGEDLALEIDWPRRYALMRLHTALHVMSCVVTAPVTGGNIAPDKARLDFDIDMTLLDADKIAEGTNELIARAVATESVWITDEELDARPELVKTMSVQPPRGAGRIRLLRIPGIDLQPCGGTHVANIAEIVGIRVTRIRNEGKHNKRVEIALSG